MSWIEVTYHLRGAARAAEAIAVEQSVEMPPSALRDPAIARSILGRVLAVEPLAPDLHAIRIALAAATVGDDAGQLLNMLFGNTSLHDDVTLEDVLLPHDLQLGLGTGPRLGLPGLRERVGAGGRALSCSALKPQGLPPAGLALLAEAFALGGIDYIKDDHGLAQQSFSPFADRVVACAAAVRRAVAATGHPTRYAPSLSGHLDAA